MSLKTFRFLAIIASLIASLYPSPSHAEQFVGLSSGGFPGIAARRGLGLQYERLNALDEPFVHAIDQASFDFKLFPLVKIEDGSDSQPGIRTVSRREVFANRSIAILDISPRVESCFLNNTTCLGLSPLTLNLYSGIGHAEAYFSPALSLRVRFRDDSGRNWGLMFESKVHFDKNVERTLKDETNIWTIGMSL